ncbi:questin oxidase family protein [Streptomyces bambusae]|uniref:questin oxidase family protein n=1 Tax=Streptomyces bambusae TaxID=1550616 RepID=UPI001CFEEA05|nr:questin oxidase family protein [Streptomyces bambusae]MCB5163791.1 questin oxidase family protein [Streptomyces bambusae]
MDTDHAQGTYDEALERLHRSGPERLGRLTNHAPMVVEALAARGRSDAVHRWLDRYEGKLEEFPPGFEPVTEAGWREALGDPRRLADWIDHFRRAVAEWPWRDVLVEWWPRLLPGLCGGSTHPVIRVGHAVRALLHGGETAPRIAELAQGLGYWAARHRPVTGIVPISGAGGAAGAAGALDRVPRIRDGVPDGFPARLAAVERLPVWAADTTEPDLAAKRLTGLVRAATHRYATHGHGEETMLVHAATAPNAVFRCLPALPRALWAPSLQAAWTAAAAVTAMYAPADPLSVHPTGALDPDEVFGRALTHGDEHVIKLADTALDVSDEPALAAVLRAIELSAPVAG